MTDNFFSRITQINYELHLMELQMASLVPKAPQEIKAAKQYDILQQIKEDTISKAVQDLQKKLPERQTKHNPLPW